MNKKTMIIAVLFFFSLSAVASAEEKKDSSTVLLIPQIEYVARDFLDPQPASGFSSELVPTIKTLKKKTLDEIVKYFKGYDVSQVEVWVTGEGSQGL